MCSEYDDHLHSGFDKVTGFDVCLQIGRVHLQGYHYNPLQQSLLRKLSVNSSDMAKAH